jgi:hypothetical protein
MKRWYVMLFVFLSGFFLAGAELSEDELELLQDSVKIGSVNDDIVDDIRGDGSDDEYFQLKFYTTQREEYKTAYTFRMRITVELNDKKTSTVGWSQFAREQGELDSEYTGQDNWRFLVPVGNMNRPKVTAYVIQYGVMVDGEFKVIAEEMDDVDSLDELLERTPNRLDTMEARAELKKPTIEHQYTYIDSNGNADTTVWE